MSLEFNDFTRKMSGIGNSVREAVSDSKFKNISLPKAETVLKNLGKIKKTPEIAERLAKLIARLGKIGCGYALTSIALIPGPQSETIMKAGLGLRDIQYKNGAAKDQRSAIGIKIRRIGDIAYAKILSNFGSLIAAVGQRSLQHTKGDSRIGKFAASAGNRGKELKTKGSFLLLSENVKELKKEKARRTEGKGQLNNAEFYARCKTYSKKLCDLANRGTTPSGEIKQAHQELFELAAGNPLLQKELKLRGALSEQILAACPQVDIRERFDSTIAHLSNKYKLEFADIEKEAALFGCSHEIAKMKMLKRLMIYLRAGLEPLSHNPSLARREEATGYDLSVIKAAEKAFKKTILENKTSSITPLEGDYVAIVTGKGLFIEETQAGSGAFKVVKFTSNYFEIKAPSERKKYVSLKAKEPEVKLESPTPPQKEASLKNATVKMPTIIEEDENSNPQTIIGPAEEEEVENSISPTVVEPSIEGTQTQGETQSGGVNLPAWAAKNYSEVTGESFDRSLPIKFWLTKDLEQELVSIQDELKMVEGDEKARIALEGKKQEFQELIQKRKADKERLNKYEVPTDVEDYAQEITTTLNLLLKLKGSKEKIAGVRFLEIHSVVDTGTGNKIVIQEAAGFKLPPKPEIKGRENEITVVDLKAMAKLNKKGLLAPEEKINFMRMLDNGFAGVQFMHEEYEHIHRDLKLENILATSDGMGALSDFGTVCDIYSNPSKGKYLGTPRFSAPETSYLAESDMWDNITEKADVWSCGMILLASGMLPSYNISNHPVWGGSLPDNPLHILARLKSLRTKQGVEIYETSFPEPEDKNSMVHLLWSATRVNPEERPSMREFRARFQALIQQETERLPQSPV